MNRPPVAPPAARGLPAIPWLALCLALTAGCAIDTRQRDARALMDQGRYEEGLAALSEASRQRPDDLPLRAEVLNREEQAAARLIAAAQTELAAGRLGEAAALFERVQRLQPANPRALAGLDAIAAERRHQAQLGQAGAKLKAGERDAAAALTRAVLQENPAQREARALMRQIEEQRTRDALVGPTLRTRALKPVSLDFRDTNLRSALNALSRSSGINFIFDKDVRADLRTTIVAQQVSVEDAIDLILATNQLEKKIVSENTVLVYPATPQKLREYQELMIRSFYLENTDAKQTMALLKTMLKTRDVFIDERLNLLTMRDTPEAIRLAERLIAAHDLAEPEVMLEVEVVEITRSRLLELGVKWTDQFGLSVAETGGAPLLLSELRGLNSSRITINAPGATASLRDNEGSANILASPRIRVRNREKARIQIGDRVPVISSQTTVATGNVLTNETVSFLDVGLKLEVEPSVHLDDEVAIKVGLEVSTLGEKTTTSRGSVAYRVGTRNANTTLRLRDGETQVLMGLIRDDERRASAKVPGVGELPILSHLFGSHLNEKQKTEVVLAITPRLVRNVKRVDAQVAEFWSGTDAALRSAPLFARAPGAAAAEAAPTGGVRPGAGAADAASAPAASDQLQLSWSGPASAARGEEFTLTLNARGSASLESASVQLEYDPRLLEFVRVAEGAREGGGTYALSHRLDEQAGAVQVRLARNVATPAGDASAMLRLTLRARQPGAADVKIGLVQASAAGRRPMVAGDAPAHSLQLLGP